MKNALQITFNNSLNPASPMKNSPVLFFTNYFDFKKNTVFFKNSNPRPSCFLPVTGSMKTTFL